jgi:hypothetical protein
VAFLGYFSTFFFGVICFFDFDSTTLLFEVVTGLDSSYFFCFFFGFAASTNS